MTSLKDLQALGGFVSEAPVEKSIKFKLDGVQEFTATVFVKHLSIGEQERIFVKSGGEDDSRTARLISEVVMLGDGKERISFEDAYKMHPRLANALIKVIGEVNGKAGAKN